MKNKGFTSIAIILIVVGILAVAGGVYWWQNDSINKLIFGEQSNGWKTYRNEEYGFEVKYPSDSLIKKPESKIDRLTLETPDSKFKEIHMIYKDGAGPGKDTEVTLFFRIEGAEFGVGGHIEEPKIPISEWINKQRWNEMILDYEGTISSINGLTVVINEQSGWGSPIGIGEFKKFLDENNKNIDDFYPYDKTVSFYNEKTGVSVGINFDTIKGKSAVYELIFNQILSTFKFTPLEIPAKY